MNSYSTKQKNYDPEYRSQRLIYVDTYFLCLQFQNTGSLTAFCIDTKVYSPSLLPYKNYYSILLYRQLSLADLVNQCLPKKRKWQEILTISQSQKYKFLNKELLPNLHLLLSFLSDRAFPWFPGKINEDMSEAHYPEVSIFLIWSCRHLWPIRLGLVTTTLQEGMLVLNAKSRIAQGTQSTTFSPQKPSSSRKLMVHVPSQIETSGLLDTYTLLCKVS